VKRQAEKKAITLRISEESNQGRKGPQSSLKREGKFNNPFEGGQNVQLEKAMGCNVRAAISRLKEERNLKKKRRMAISKKKKGHNNY